MKLAHVVQVAFIVAAAIFVFSFVRAAQSDHRLSNCQALCQLSPTYAARDRKVPEFELPDMTGKMVKFSSFLGKKPIILNFWTRTCEPCLEEMPAIQEMAAMLKKQGIRVVTINTDEGPDEIRDVLKVRLQGQEPQFEILFDPETTVVTDMFGTTLYPETWIIDPDGIIRLRIDGKRDWTSATALEVIEMLSRPLACPVEFTHGRLSKHGELCDCAPANASCMADVECCDPEMSCVKGFCKKTPQTTAPARPPGSQPMRPPAAPRSASPKPKAPPSPSASSG
jgi:peroxiredoxin